MKTRWMLAIALVVVASAVGTTTAAAPSEPATPAALSGDIQQVHDPTMVREGDAWYVFSTGDGITIRRSTDMRHWERVGYVFPDAMPDWLYDEIPSLDPAIRHAWAPDVSFVDERWHLYWSTAEFGTRDALIGLVTNAALDPDSPDYEWVDEGLVLSSDTPAATAAIDPNAVTDSNGDRWLVWGSFWDGIFVRRLDRETGKLLPGAPATNIARRNQWWEGVEGAYVVQHDGWWWLFASYGFCCKGVQSNYSVHVGRSRSLTGPYVDAAGRSLTAGGGTTLLGSYDHVVGPGHGSVVALDADTLGFVHHYYDAQADGIPTLSLRELVWGPDGWPVAVDPGFERGAPTAVEGQWRLRGYPQECVSRPPEDVTVTLHRDGRVTPSGRWRVDGHVLHIEEVGAEARSWWLAVDETQSTGFGRDDRTAAVRATRVEGRADAVTTIPCTPAPPGSDHEPPTAPPVSAAPDFTG